MIETNYKVAGKNREICPHCSSVFTCSVKYDAYSPMPNTEEGGAVNEYVCAECGIKFISTRDRERLFNNLIATEEKNAAKEH